MNTPTPYIPQRQNQQPQDYYDSLTGMPNAALFRARLDQAVTRSVQQNTMLAVMRLNIDFFKAVNETHGAAVGDDLLVAFTARVCSVIRDTDTLARFGGDDFGLILENMGTLSDIEAAAMAIAAAAKREFIVRSKRIMVSASIGVAICTGLRINPDDLIKRADGALMDAKRSGRNGFRI